MVWSSEDENICKDLPGWGYTVKVYRVHFLRAIHNFHENGYTVKERGYTAEGEVPLPYKKLPKKTDKSTEERTLSFDGVRI